MPVVLCRANRLILAREHDRLHLPIAGQGHHGSGRVARSNSATSSVPPASRSKSRVDRQLGKEEP